MDASKQDESEHRIRVRAYKIWEFEGRPEGRADEHWHAARAELEAQSESANASVEDAPKRSKPADSSTTKAASRAA